MSETATDPSRRRRRAGLGLFALSTVIAFAALLMTALLVDDGPAPQPPGPVAAPPPVPQDGQGEWDLAAEHVLTTRPMLDLPVQSAMPQALSSETAGDPITLPAPGEVTGRWVPGGFGPTGEGAVAQLAAATEKGMRGADPALLARAYREISLPGAPDPAGAVLSRTAADLRSHAEMKTTGPVPTLLASYDITHAQIKGTADHGRFAVVCVLGELAVDYQGTTAKAGLGDCQAMRWSGGQWRIAPIARAATAPSAWPGSADAVHAGYREVRDA